MFTSSVIPASDPYSNECPIYKIPSFITKPVQKPEMVNVPRRDMDDLVNRVKSLQQDLACAHDEINKLNCIVNSLTTENDSIKCQIEYLTERIIKMAAAFTD